MSAVLTKSIDVTQDRPKRQPRIVKGSLSVLGPFDLRRQRSRCERCIGDHAKCSKTQPCQHCTRKGVSCKYAEAGAPTMDLEQITFMTTTPVPPAGRSFLLDEPTTVITNFVDNFLRRNQFSGSHRDSEHVLSQFRRNGALYHVAYAIGSLDLLTQRKAQGHGEPRTSPAHAIQSYRLACSILRSQLQSVPSELYYIDLIETTLLMGLFELKHSSDTVGWRRHYIYGTREFLQRLGPEACRTGPAKDLLLKVRIFEIITSISFAFRSFLATDPWLETLQAIWRDEERPLKETMLDFATTCSDHCLWSAEYATSLPEIISHAERARLIVLAQEAVDMRSSLDRWKFLAEQDNQLLSSTDGIIAWSVYHTISIYLHTTFALHPRWATLDIETPILQPSAVALHIESLASIIDQAVEFSAACPIIFLLPLYVAGNAVSTAEHRHQVKALLERIEQRYCFVRKSNKQGLPFWTPDEALVTNADNNIVLKDRRRALLIKLSRAAPT